MSVVAHAIVIRVFEDGALAFAVDELDLPGKAARAEFVNAIARDHPHLAEKIHRVQRGELRTQRLLRCFEHEPSCERILGILKSERLPVVDESLWHQHDDR